MELQDCSIIFLGAKFGNQSWAQAPEWKAMLAPWHSLIPSPYTVQIGCWNLRKPALPTVPEETFKEKRLKAFRIPFKLSLSPTHYRGGEI